MCRPEPGIPGSVSNWVQVVNSGRKGNKTKTANGIAKATGTPGLLRVTFFWPFYADYRVMSIDEQYSRALVGSASSMRVTLHFPRFVSVLCKFETPTKSSPPPNNHISQNHRLSTEDFHCSKQGLSPQAPSGYPLASLGPHCVRRICPNRTSISLRCSSFRY